MKLAHIQRQLQQLYDLPEGGQVEGFLCTPTQVRALAAAQRQRGELLLVRSQGQDTEVALYLAPFVWDCTATSPQPELAAGDFAATCLATEGVSHFLLLQFRDRFGHALSELELELQSEIDKYASAMVASWHTRGRGRRSWQLRQRLFERITFHDHRHSHAGQRYRLANRCAARYAAFLERRYIAQQDLRGLLRELRRFYRQGLHRKLTAT